MSTRALILCAGKGKRLGELTRRTPKPMIKIGKKPCLEWIVEHLNKHGIHEIIVNLHHRPMRIIQYFGDRLLYFYEPELLGERATENRLKSWLGDEYVLVNGDTLTDINITAMAKRNIGGRLLASDSGIYTGVTHVKKGFVHKRRRWECVHRWQDIGNPERLARARKEWPRV